MMNQKCRIRPSIGMPIDLIPAPSSRVTKLMNIASASESKNIVAVEDNRLKWEQQEGPGIFLPY